jgi:endoglucanase
MRLGRRSTLTAICLAAAFFAPAAARAATFDPNGFRLESTALYVHENAGSAVVTIERRDTSVEAQIRYIVIGMTASANVDYTPVKAMIDFAKGQSSATFQVPIVDHGIPGPPKTIQVSLFGPSPIGMGAPSTGALTIINDDAVSVVRDPTNPLGLARTSVSADPLSGARFFVDRTWGYAARQAAHWRYRHPSWARTLEVIGAQPGTHRFGGWDGSDPGVKVSGYLARAAYEQPGAVPMLSTYRIVDGHCGNWSDPPSAQAAYHRWIASFASGIGAYRAVLFLEMDSIITTGCLSGQGLRVRLHELHDAISTLAANCPRLVVYLDAGAADAVPAPRVAHLLRLAGVAQIQGFFLNSTHFDWTSREISFGERISRMTGGKHFVVNTGENGQGPVVPWDRVHQGNEVLCNPPHRGLGPRPTSNTGYPNVDAFAWTSNPGESGGACVPGAPPTGMYWPQYAMSLVHHANFRVR